MTDTAALTPLAKPVPAPRNRQNSSRCVSKGLAVVLVAHTLAEDRPFDEPVEVIRIISARPAPRPTLYAGEGVNLDTGRLHGLLDCRLHQTGHHHFRIELIIQHHY